MSDVLVIIGPALMPTRRADLAAIGFAGQAAEGMSGGAHDILLLGPEAASAASELAGCGARKVFVASHEALENYTAEAYAAAVVAFVKNRNYRLLGAATTSASREFLPRVAARLDVAMASDILSLDALESEKVVFTRAVFVGNLLASVELSGSLAIATCRASEFKAPEPAGSSDIENVDLGAGLGAHARKRFVSLSRAKSERPELTEAETVVTAGRGTRGPEEGIPLVEALTDLLGAALGSTRAVVDAGWLPNEYQVGQTGKIVAPKLYIAVGVSGAIQHLAGMRNSKTIVAINKDPEAPIFEVADFGLVADLFKAVPEMVETIKSLKGISVA